MFGQNINNFIFDTNNEGVTITGYRGYDHIVVFPSKINDIPVTAIELINGSRVIFEEIVIPDSVKRIGLNSFARNPLKIIKMPANVRLEQ
jgi:hypothetical protein